MKTDRVASIIVGFIYIALAASAQYDYANDENLERILQCSAILLPMLLIWFGDALGTLAADYLKIEDKQTPGFALKTFGWALLVPLTVLAVSAALGL